MRTRGWYRLCRGTAVVAVLAVATSVAGSPEPPAPAATVAAPADATTLAGTGGAGAGEPESTEDGPVRQTEAEAAATAIATGKPVEVGAFRGERRAVYVNPDGSHTETHHQQPFRTVRQGRWVPVDATLVRQPDGTVTPRAATVGLRLSGGGDGPLASIERAGRRMTFSWPARLPAPVLTGDTATYPEVMSGVDLVVHAAVTGFSHVLVIKTPDAARQPGVSELTLGVDADGLTVTEQSDGRLTAVDPATNGVVFDAPAPLMWDSGDPAETGAGPADGQARGAAPTTGPPTRVAPESARTSRLGVRVDGDRLRLTPDRAMLTDPATRFPVYVDPYWQGTNRSAWAMVDSGYPDESYWKFDGERHERIGLCPESCGRNSKIKRLFYALPTPYQNDALNIMAAEFKVTMVHTYNSSAHDASLYRVSKGISSATTWRNQPGWSVKQDTKRPTTTQSSCTSTNHNVTFDARPAVLEAQRNNWSTTTFGLRADNEASIYAVKRFCDNAVLSVRYNRPPSQPAVSGLSMDPGGSCVFGANRPYVSRLPRLFAILKDPDTGDAEPLTAEFRVTWTPNGGTLQTKTWRSPEKANGSTFQYDLAASTGVPNLPENVVTSWDVRAHDGTSWGPWSSDGSANPCQFILDKTKPAGPDVDSAEYLPLDEPDTAPACVPDDTVYDGVGRYGTFRFDSAATDVHKYEFGFNTDPSPLNTLVPATDGGPVTVTWLPETEGPHQIQVRAIDRAGKTSDTTVCYFRVAPGAAPVAEWTLADATGATSAEDGRGTAPAAAGPAATFGVAGPGGAADRAVYLGGDAGGYLATASAELVATDGGFAVSAWLRSEPGSAAGRERVAVSQDGTGGPGFTLGIDAATGRWKFELPVTDVRSLGRWRVLGPVAEAGEWTHLVAVHDPTKRTIALHVNGAAPVLAERRSISRSRGAVQFGRRSDASGHMAPWHGSLADITLFNRMVTGPEVTALSTLVPARQGYWEFDTVTDPEEGATVLISPEFSGDEARNMSLYGGANVYLPDPDPGTFPPPEPALVGAGHLVLDGVDDYAAAAGALAETDGNFTVTARVRLAAECDREMTILSQPGTHTSAFVLRCATVGGMPRYELLLPHADTAAGPPVTVVYDDQRLPNTDSAGQHLAVTYDAFRNQVRLYVDGQLAGAAQAEHADVWPARGGGLQVGRARLNAAWGGHFAGVVDDVRVYSGVLDATTIQLLANPTAQPDV
ncbi:LamG domain-containing protein [Polymorphospora rubra]|uniref:LamG domain-containing protein n=1 Tax=Polymorphospora rubra TaxID=338584 RepID=UPI00340862CA